MTNIFVKFLKVQDRSPFVRNPLRLRYCEVLTIILFLYWTYLTNGSFLKKSSNFCIKNIGGFGRDGRVARSNPLPRSIFVPGRLVAFPDYINMLLISTN